MSHVTKEVDWMQKIRIAVAIISVLSLVVIICSEFLLPWYIQRYIQHKFAIKTNGRGASSIGIIGGADGPTAIFVAGKMSSHLFKTVLKWTLVLGIAFLFLTRNR
jgi:lipopolysaccharide export LptBFGC system permease protein LptF